MTLLTQVLMVEILWLVQQVASSHAASEQEVEEAAAMDSAEDLQAAIAANPQDLESRYALAIVQMVAGETELALQICLDILREDREFRDDIGRLTMIRIFDILGKGNETATKYRRKLFNALH